MDENIAPESIILSGKPSEIVDSESSILTQTEDPDVQQSKSWGWFLIGVIGIPILCGILIAIEQEIGAGFIESGGRFSHEHRDDNEIDIQGTIIISEQNYTVFSSEYNILVKSDGETNSRIEEIYIEFGDDVCGGGYSYGNPEDWKNMDWCSAYDLDDNIILTENIFWRQNETYFEFAFHENITSYDGFEVTHMGVDYAPDPSIENTLMMIQNLILFLIPVLIIGSIIWGFTRGDRMFAWGTLTGVFLAPVAFFILFLVFVILAVGLDSLGMDFS